MNEISNAYRIEGSKMTKWINVAIAVAVVAVLASGGVLAYLHFRSDTKVPSTMERDRAKWQQLVDENPDNHLARANLGSVYLDMGDADSAIRELTIALDQQPDSYTYMAKLASAYIKNGDYDVAIALNMRQADILPVGEKYAPLYDAADASMKKGDREGAKDFVRKSIDDNDIIWNSHYLLGRILEEEGDTSGARDEYLKAAKYNSTDQGLQDALARVTPPAQLAPPAEQPAQSS